MTEGEPKAQNGAFASAPFITGMFFTTTLPRTDSAKAYLEAKGEGYLLKAGSLVSKMATENLPVNIRRLRDRLILEKALVDEGGPCLKLKRDISFAKPSPASAFVKGRTSSGYLEWRRMADSKRLGDIFAGSGRSMT
jgi:hypothetical protein